MSHKRKTIIKKNLTFIRKWFEHSKYNYFASHRSNISSPSSGNETSIFVGEAVFFIFYFQNYDAWCGIASAPLNLNHTTQETCSPIIACNYSPRQIQQRASVCAI